MANFLKPAGVGNQGYDSRLNKQKISIHHYSTLGLWGGGPSGAPLRVALNDPSIGTVTELPKQGDTRVFKVTAMKAGSAMLEARAPGGGVWAFVQIEVTGAAGSARVKRIVVNTMAQTLKAYEDGVLVFSFECVTGDEGHPTTKGVFNVTDRYRDYTSHTYHVPMNYALFFTTDGKAIHQYHGVLPLSIVRTMKSSVSDWFGSHGCVRLTKEDAQQLFDWTPRHTLVEVR